MFDESSPLYKAAYKVVERIGQGRAFFVGGCIRDTILELPLKDIDIATELGPKQVMSLFPGSELIGADFGVVLIKMDGHAFETTTFRIDGRYINFRKPVSVTFGTMQDDANRRDFTINALYYDPIKEEIIDLVDGLTDLKYRMLKCVGDPMERFGEDALRILRAVRFNIRLNMNCNYDMMFAAKKLAPNLAKISAERIRDELTRIMIHEQAPEAFELMCHWGVLEVLLPEVVKLIGCKQSPIHHKEGDAWVHTMLVLKNIEPRDSVHVWSALLHDIAKPDCFSEFENFHGHAEMGAKMSETILSRLKFSNDEKNLIISAVRDHMKFLDITKMKKSRLRNFMSEDHFELGKNLHRADCESSSKDFTALEYLKDKTQEFIQEDGAVLPKALVDGDQVMKRLGIAPGPLVGKILNKIREAQLEGIITTEVGALSYADVLLESNTNEEY